MRTRKGGKGEIRQEVREHKNNHLTFLCPSAYSTVVYNVYTCTVYTIYMYTLAYTLSV